jgi:hypothetical protein
MNTTELHDLFRQEVFDLADPPLWPSSFIYAAIDEAQKQFCRDAYGIEDARSFTVTIKADGTEWYAIDPRIIQIRSAIRKDNGREVPIVAVEKMINEGLRFDGAQGPLRALISGMEKGYLRTVPIPNTALVVELRTFRLPNDVVAGDDFEIADQHVRNLLYWVKYRAYSVQDSEAGNKQLAKDNYDLFGAYCLKARVEANRLRRPVSTVTYGGI